MCANCITGYEALALNSMALASAGSSLWHRITSPMPRDVARRQAWNENASLMCSMGLDPETVLGPPPAVEHQPVEPEPVSGSRVTTEAEPESVLV